MTAVAWHQASCARLADLILFLNKRRPGLFPSGLEKPMNKLNDEEHRRPEFSHTTKKEVRTTKTTVEQKFDQEGNPVGPPEVDHQEKDRSR